MNLHYGPVTETLTINGELMERCGTEVTVFIQAIETYAKAFSHACDSGTPEDRAKYVAKYFEILSLKPSDAGNAIRKIVTHIYPHSSIANAASALFSDVQDAGIALIKAINNVSFVIALAKLNEFSDLSEMREKQKVCRMKNTPESTKELGDGNQPSQTAPNKGSPEYIFEQMNQLIRVLEAQQREIMELKMRNNVIEYRLEALERKMNGDKQRES